jgi:hypothetical protein
MDCLLAYCQEAWTIPKRFKGNSAAMGFFPEFLIFEIVKQCLEKKHSFNFRQTDRSQISNGRMETAYFVDEHEAPKRLLVQGLKIRENDYGFPLTDYQHDVTYMVKDGNWRVKAIIEVKGFFKSTSMNGDFHRLETAEKKYPKTDDCVFAFVGFIRSEDLSKPSKATICPFVMRKNHFVVLPGGIDSEIGNSSLERLLDRL